jgi:hypothetical protein
MKSREYEWDTGDLPAYTVKMMLLKMINWNHQER